MTELIPLTFIYIKKHEKDDGIKFHEKMKSKYEFNYLKRITDKDEEHIKNFYNCKPDCKKNRYSDIRPYSHNIVKITNDSDDYINASWVHIPEKNSMIAAQGPKENSIEDFWNMCYSNDVKVIIMLCKLKENGKTKCANYFGSPKMNHFTLNQSPNEEKINGLILRKFELKKDNQDIKNIVQIHYEDWPDHGVPQKAYETIIKLIELIEEYKGNSPFVVHCSAGVGRTGTFSAIYNLYFEILRQINDTTNQDYIKFSVVNIVRKLKEFRLYMVENYDQYTFIYEFLSLFLENTNV